MKGRTVLLTGGTAGIGKVAARELVKLGARVVIVGRNPEKSARVAKEIGAEYLLADLSSMKAVRQLADDFIGKYGALNVLVNNAGGINPKHERTVDGFERTFATNHLAYFVLANALLPALEKGAAESGRRSRIINVSSHAHRMGPMRFDALNAEKGYSAWSAYGQSKLANLLFTKELSRRLEGKPIVVNALHPGFVASDFLTKPGFWGFVKPIVNLFAVSEDQGAATTVFLASDDAADQHSGKYFYKKKICQPKRFAEDDIAARRLWDESERLLTGA